MDEPFGALDDSTRQVMQLFILEQWSELKMTVFFVTHDLEEALFLGTRILVLSQYYSTDDDRIEGSKIVTDKEIPGGHPKPTNFKYMPEFIALLEQVRKDGLDPDHKQHISEFDLSHKDAFRTVNVDEWKR
jgi:NitT/TauT family transport system ATP-binding protein